MVSLSLSEKTIDCLRIAAAAGTSARGFRYLAASRRYGAQPLVRRLETLARLGYIEPAVRGRTVRTSPLTEQGRRVLDGIEAARNPLRLVS